MAGSAIVAMILIWGTTWAAIRVGLEHVPPFTGVAIRFALAGVVLLGFARALGIRLGRGPTERRLWLVQGTFSFTISYCVTYWAEQWVPSGLTSVLFATFPLFVALLAHIYLPAERLRPLGTLGVVVGFAGVAVIYSEDFSLLGGPQVALASGVMLLSPLAAAIGNVVVKRVGHDVHPVSVNAGGMVFTAAVTGLLAGWLERGQAMAFNWVSVGSIVYLALFGTALTFSLYFWLLHHMEARKLALIAYVIPVVAVTLGTLAFDEPLTVKTVAGAGLVLVGVAAASR